MKQMSLLLLLGSVACAANTPSAMTAAKIKANSTVAGLIQFPGKVIPSMRICALNTQTKSISCVKIRAGQTKYLIKGLVAAEYQILANVKDNELRIGGHMLQVQCIRAPCPALLNTVLLKTKESKTDIHLNGFYRSREDFPTLTLSTR